MRETERWINGWLYLRVPADKLPRGADEWQPAPAADVIARLKDMLRRADECVAWEAIPSLGRGFGEEIEAVLGIGDKTGDLA